MYEELSEKIASYAVVFGIGALLGAIVVAVGIGALIFVLSDIEMLIQYRSLRAERKRTKEGGTNDG